MKILLTNDDGIDGEGLTALASALKRAGHEVYIVAPDCNNSAVSHKINMRAPLRLVNCSTNGEYSYSLSGTPADCVLFALYALNVKPDIVLSGINDGNNLGSDCMYSGTVAAAQEGAQNGIPSIAVSTDFHCDRAMFDRAANMLVQYLEQWVEYARQIRGALNVNIPARTEVKGVRFCRNAKMSYFPQYGKLDGEEGLYQYCFESRLEVEEGENDAQLFRAGYVTLTPLRIDLTDDNVLNGWKR